MDLFPDCAAVTDDIYGCSSRPVQPRPSHISGINVLYFAGDVTWHGDEDLFGSNYDRWESLMYMVTELDR
jgi:hypothetical protein